MAVFTLKHPLKVAYTGVHKGRPSTVIEEITLGPLTVKHVDRLTEYRGEPFVLALNAISLLSGITVNQVRKLDLDDLQPIAAEVLRQLSEIAVALGLPADHFVNRSTPTKR